jgi:ATP-binding cassette subfamily B protein
MTPAVPYTSTPSPLRFLLGYVVKYPKSLAKAVGAVVVTASSILAVGYGIRTLVDRGFTAESTSLLNFSALILVALALLLAGAAYVRTSTTALLAERIITDIRRQLFSHTLDLQIPYFENAKLGDMLSHFNSDCEHIRIFLSGSAAVAIRTLLQLLGGTILLVHASPKMTLIVFAMIPFVLIPIVLFGRQVKNLTHTVQTLDGQALSVAEERLNAITTLKAYTAERHACTLFDTLLDSKLQVVKRRTHFRSLLISLVIGLVFSSIAIILWVGAREVIQGHLTPGQLSAFVFYAILVAGSLNSFAEIVGEHSMAMGATRRLLTLLAQPVEENSSLTPLATFETLTFQDLKFAYPSRPTLNIFEKLSFEVHAGQKIAIVGPSGVGKSTIFKLLLRYYTPTGGRLILNGSDVSSYSLASTRSLFALVPQDPVIFNASVLENIALGGLDKSEDAIIQAAKAAYVDEFVAKFPEGYHTLLGEKGIRLSGGQKQRIALARAILKDAPIYLLDEATNALDSESEARIHATLSTVLKNKTALIIAHRLSTVKEADRILVLSEGKIEGIGTHASLMKKSALYRTLAQHQFLDNADA